MTLLEDFRFMNTYTELIDKHKGENCFIYGAGPSLYFNMHESLYSWFNTYGVTIAVNSGSLAEPDFDYWVSNDSLCRRWDYWKKVKKGKGIKVVRNSWEKYKKELDGFLYFEPRPTPEDIINPEDIGLAYCSSVPSSIDLAIQMGCKKIFVLGLDHNSYDGKDHYWQFWRNHLQPKANPVAQGPWKEQQKVFPFNMKAYKALKKFADYKNVEIYNLNKVISGNYITKVRIFKRIQMKDVKKILGSVDDYI